MTGTGNNISTARAYGRARSRSRLRTVAAVVAFALTSVVLQTSTASGAPTGDAADGRPRINQVQVVGTHNSYHLRPAFPLSLLTAVFPGWDVQSAPLDVQLERENVRKVELDVFWNADLARFVVSHIPVVDDRTTCRLLTDCLAVMRASAERNPGRSPVFIQIEPKLGLDVFAPIAPNVDALDAEILSALGRDRLITPDDVRGPAPTLRAATTGGGWPTVDESRGKFLVFMDVSGDPSNPFTANYTAGRPNLEGRAGFVPAASTADDRAAVFVRNTASDPLIPQLIADGFIVRTRADTVADRDAAFASGATMVSTDRPTIGHDTPGTGTAVVALPGDRPARCNPVSAPPGCDDDDIEPATVRAPQELSVTVLRPGAAQGAVFETSATLAARPLGAGPAAAVDGPDRLVGSATTDDVSVRADVFRPFGLPFVLGEVRVTAPSAGLDVTVPAFLSQFTSGVENGRDVYRLRGPALPSGAFPFPAGEAFLTLVD